MLTRRERLERIAMAERDRRAGRVEVAIAALGEASEWPARVVLALARLPESGAAESQRILEAGLDLWAEEAGLAPLDEALEAAPSDLERPIDNHELERAFAEAEAQTDEMHDANRVAERVLMDEPVGLAEMAGDALSPIEEFDVLEMDAAEADDEGLRMPSMEALEGADSTSSDAQVVAILERWLQNLQASRAGRAR